MQKFFNKFSAFVLSVVMLFGLVSVSVPAAEPSVAEATAVMETAYTGSYYSQITATEGNELLGQVHDLITTTHKKYTSYDDCKNPTYVKKTDPGTGGALMEFYARANLSSSWQGGASGTWNREHVWCQSHSNGLWGTSGGGGDLHHIRPTESRVNSSRSNNKYGEFSGGNTVWYKDSSNTQIAIAGYTSGGKFMPKDEVKGDVARIVMYVYTHYNTFRNVYGSTNGSGRSSCFGNLKFTDIMAPTSESAAITLLLKWNESDPVDQSEITRNEAVYEIQGNRNPFIDHPEYAEAIWGDGTITPDPSELTALTLTPATVSIPVGQSRALTVTATPANASKAVTWSSSDATVASVADGVVTARNEGTATITATSAVKPSVKATATIHVTKASVGGEEGSFTITRSTFASPSASYDFQPWSAGGVEGVAYIYGANADAMQFNSSKTEHYLATTTPVPGAIKSVTVKMQEGKDSKEWALYTSASPYDEMSGNPSGEHECGTQTVTEEGVTWTVEGSDSYFALVYMDSGAAYLDSIVVEYGEGGGGGSEHVHHYEYQSFDDDDHIYVCTECGDVQKREPHEYSDENDTTCDVCGHERTIGGGGTQEDGKNLEAFHSAVASIVTEGPLSERFASINKAIQAYQTLSESERTLAEEDLEVLLAEIALYNESVHGYNADAEQADRAALHGGSADG